ncbi:unnamed protein product [Ambrosiozyma monospora]|uniref:Unnamed protein product n=1 Tax=Ambrosiozyma monospora TaxID=43982 RepID=A0ACB5SU49_AMBMO|nr:unnamed protein product [Ambrosiozyma monospora]
MKLSVKSKLQSFKGTVKKAFKAKNKNQKQQQHTLEQDATNPILSTCPGAGSLSNGTAGDSHVSIDQSTSQDQSRSLSAAHVEIPLIAKNPSSLTPQSSAIIATCNHFSETQAKYGEILLSPKFSTISEPHSSKTDSISPLFYKQKSQLDQEHLLKDETLLRFQDESRSPPTTEAEIPLSTNDDPCSCTPQLFSNVASHTTNSKYGKLASFESPTKSLLSSKLASTSKKTFPRTESCIPLPSSSLSHERMNTRSFETALKNIWSAIREFCSHFFAQKCTLSHFSSNSNIQSFVFKINKGHKKRKQKIQPQQWNMLEKRTPNVATPNTGVKTHFKRGESPRDIEVSSKIASSPATSISNRKNLKRKPPPPLPPQKPKTDLSENEFWREIRFAKASALSRSTNKYSRSQNFPPPSLSLPHHKLVADLSGSGFWREIRVKKACAMSKSTIMLLQELCFVKY